MNSNLVIIGVGGSGAKIVESLIQLAASSNTPTTIYPVLFDQDIHNGNVEQCKRVIDTYTELHRHVSNRNDRKTFLPNVIKVSDSLLPIVPTKSDISFKAAIGMSSMKDDEEKLIKAIYNEFQLNDILDAGFKKRAYMGSVLINKQLEEQDKLRPEDPGLNMIISKTSSFDNLNVFICGSIFGGTGSSGIVNIGKYFKSKLPNASISAILMLPYFTISDHYSDESVKGIVRSDSDMHLIKIALGMYKDEIEKQFHNVFLIGSDISSVKNEFATTNAEPSGTKQKNPSHIFELVAASAPLYIPENSDTTNYFSFLISPTDDIDKPPVTFEISDLPEKVNAERMILVKEFACLLTKSKSLTNSWKKRQPWIFNDPSFSMLSNWAKRHYNWWCEMIAERQQDGHIWEIFNIVDKEYFDVFKMSALISQNLPGKEASSISDIFYSLDQIIKS